MASRQNARRGLKRGKRWGAALVAALLAGALPGPPSQADIARPQDVDQLLEVMRSAIAATGKASDLQIQPADHALLFSWNGAQLVAYPDNLFRKMQAAATDAERQDLLDTYIAGFDAIEPMAEAPLDPAQLYPVLRPTVFAASLPAGKDMVSTPWQAGLSLFLVEDQPHSSSYLTHRRMAEAGLDLETARKTALANLARLSPDFVALDAADFGPDRYGMVLDGTYESSLLLDADLWRRKSEDWGLLRMAVPARDMVVIDVSHSDAAIAELGALAERLYDQSAYPVSKQVWEWRGHDWQPVR